METSLDSKVVTLDDMSGAFIDSLRRNNKQIRSDRALQIAEAAEMLYKRTIEDKKLTMRQLMRDREAMLDMSPETAISLKLASDFNAEDFVRKDIDIGVKMRNLQIEIDIAVAQYNRLFTPAASTPINEKKGGSNGV